jgi:hypothetical protein
MGSVVANNRKTPFISFYTHEERRALPSTLLKVSQIKPEEAHIMFYYQRVFMQQEEKIFLHKTRITANKM